MTTEWRWRRDLAAIIAATSLLHRDLSCGLAADRSAKLTGSGSRFLADCGASYSSDLRSLFRMIV